MAIDLYGIIKLQSENENVWWELALNQRVLKVAFILKIKIAVKAERMQKPVSFKKISFCAK